METDFSYVDENLKRIKDNIAEAVAKYRSPGDNVTLMGVTKTQSVEAINRSVDLGVKDLGENRVQEYLSKKDGYRDGVRMHFIGHLQTNKVKYIINDMVLIHSVDSVHLAKEINRLAEKNSKVQDILIEINIGDEDTKSGIEIADTDELIAQIENMKNINLRGFMAIPPAGSDEEFLAKMQEIYEDEKQKLAGKYNIDTLSMGMSGDYVNAIKYGATIVRIGSALYGARDYSKK